MAVDERTTEGIIHSIPSELKRDANDVWIARNAGDMTADKAAYPDQAQAETSIIQQSGRYGAALLLAALREDGLIVGSIDEQRLIASMHRLNKAPEEATALVSEGAQ